MTASSRSSGTGIKGHQFWNLRSFGILGSVDWYRSFETTYLLKISLKTVVVVVVVVVVDDNDDNYRVILSVLDPRKCEYLKDYSLDFEHAYMTTYLAS